MSLTALSATVPRPNPPNSAIFTPPKLTASFKPGTAPRALPTASPTELPKTLILPIPSSPLTAPSTIGSLLTRFPAASQKPLTALRPREVPLPGSNPPPVPGIKPLPAIAPPNAGADCLRSLPPPCLLIASRVLIPHWRCPPKNSPTFC